MYNQYFSTRPKLSIVMPSSKRIFFSGGVYVTDKEDEIAFLDAEVKLGHPMIYTKKGEEKVTSEQLDPLAAIKRKAVEEHLAKQAGGSTGMVSSAGTATAAASNSKK